MYVYIAYYLFPIAPCLLRSWWRQCYWGWGFQVASRRAHSSNSTLAATNQDAAYHFLDQGSRFVSLDNFGLFASKLRLSCVVHVVLPLADVLNEVGCIPICCCDNLYLSHHLSLVSLVFIWCIIRFCIRKETLPIDCLCFPCNLSMMVIRCLSDCLGVPQLMDPS